MERTIVATHSAPAAIGPYSQAVRAGSFVFVSGQLGLDPATGALVAGGIEEETHQALSNLKAVLDAAGASMKQVVKTTVFLADMRDFHAVNGVYGQFFDAHAPARSTVQVAALPKNGRVEIEAVAVLDT